MNLTPISKPLREFLESLEMASDNELQGLYNVIDCDTRFSKEEIEYIKFAINNKLESTIQNEGPTPFRISKCEWDEKISNTRKSLKDGERYYSFNIVTYQTNEQYFSNLLKEAKHWAYILHDKDEQSPHLHILATFKTQKSRSQIFDMLDHELNFENGAQNTNIEDNKDIEASIKYFLHDGYDDKYQYSVEDLNFDEPSYWLSRYISKDNPDDATDNFIDDLMSFTFLQMCRKYGRDFMINSMKYMKCRRVIERETGDFTHAEETDAIISYLK